MHGVVRRAGNALRVDFQPPSSNIQAPTSNITRPRRMPGRPISGDRKPDHHPHILMIENVAVHQDQIAGEVGVLGPHHERPEPWHDHRVRVPVEWYGDAVR